MSTIIDTLIYDRTADDVTQVATLKAKILQKGLATLTPAENAEYYAGMKGAYNATDLNRVGGAVSYVANYMTDLPDNMESYRDGRGVADDDAFEFPYDFSGVSVTAKTDWNMADIPSQVQESAYLADLTNLRGQVTLPDYAPVVPATLNGLTYDIANDIEYLLYVIDDTITGIEDDYVDLIDRAALGFAYAGIEYCGA